MPRLIEIVLGKPSPGPGGLLSFPQFIYNFLHRPVHATREYRMQGFKNWTFAQAQSRTFENKSILSKRLKSLCLVIISRREGRDRLAQIEALVTRPKGDHYQFITQEDVVPSFCRPDMWGNLWSGSDEPQDITRSIPIFCKGLMITYLNLHRGNSA